jgi:hypothetical protein
MVAVWILIAEIACVFLWHCSYRGIPKVIPQKRGGAVVAPRAETASSFLAVRGCDFPGRAALHVSGEQASPYV